MLIASVLALCPLANASSHSVLPLKNRAELSAENGQIGVESPSLTAAIASSNYDALAEVASDSSVAPKSGGRAWTWGYGRIGDEAAEGAYQAIRESTTDVAAISRYTKLKSDRLQKIKDYLFNNPEWTGADGEIAAAWHRLRTGRGTDVDKLLLKHETAEMWLRQVKGLGYLDAHRLSNEKYNWQKIIEGALD